MTPNIASFRELGIESSERTATAKAKEREALGPEYLRLAGQIRGLALAGQRVILLCPVGKIDGADQIAKGVAEALKQLAEYPVMVVSVTGEARSDAILRDAFPSDLSAEPYGEMGRAVGTRRELEKVVFVDALAMGSAESFPALLNRARTQCKHILIEAPSILDSATTVVAAAHSDAVVLIAKQGVTTQSELERSKQQFLGVGTLIAGFIFLS